MQSLQFGLLVQAPLPQRMYLPRMEAWSLIDICRCLRPAPCKFAGPLDPDPQLPELYTFETKHTPILTGFRFYLLHDTHLSHLGYF